MVVEEYLYYYLSGTDDVTEKQQLSSRNENIYTSRRGQSRLQGEYEGPLLQKIPKRLRYNSVEEKRIPNYKISRI